MVMTLAEVVSEVRAWADGVAGRYLNPDLTAGAQCVDVPKQFGKDLHGLDPMQTLGNGIDQANGLVSIAGWVAATASAMQAGDVVSLNWGGPAGHVVLLLDRLADGRWVIMDQNRAGTAENPSGPAEIRTVALTYGITGVARPPRYVGATAPAPAKSAREVLAADLFLVDEVIAGAARAGVPLHLAAALAWQETRGRNIYGHDAGGIFSTNPDGCNVAGTWYPAGANVPVTATNWAAFKGELIAPDGTWTGRKSNGVGMLQITYPGTIINAVKAGVDPSDPVQNMAYGLGLWVNECGLGTDYSEANVKLAATRYNRGPQATEVNAYGESVWAQAEKFRVALAGASATAPAPVTPAPQPGTGSVQAPTLNFNPLVGVVTSDPGSRAVVLSSAVTVALPDPAPGPRRPAVSLISACRVLVWWRGKAWSPVSGSIAHEIKIPGPDQSPLGAVMAAASGDLVIARPGLVSTHGWDPLVDDVPRPNEPIGITATVDGGATWETIFTGKIDGSSAKVTELGVHVGIVDRSDDLRALVSHPAFNHRHPSTERGKPYLALGTHPLHLTDWAARAAGRYATPPAPEEAIFSAPMMGSAWPEAGSAYACSVIDPNGATAAIAADSPMARLTPWGLGMENIWARYRPDLAGTSGMLDRPLGLRFMAHAPTGNPGWTEFWWDRDSIMVQVRRGAVIVEIQSGWLDNGWRKVVWSRTRTLTEAQSMGGCQVTVWIDPDGSLSIDVDGETTVHEPFLTLPETMRTRPMDDVRVTVFPDGAMIGGVVAVNSWDKTLLGPWERRFVPHLTEEDADKMLKGIPHISDRPARDLLDEQAESELSSVWIDAEDTLHYATRLWLDQQESVRTLTDSDVTDRDWKMGRGSVHPRIDATWLEPLMMCDRLTSEPTQTVWEGPTPTLRPTESWDDVVTVPDGEDWVGVDEGFYQTSAGDGLALSDGIGSLFPAHVRVEGADGKQVEVVADPALVAPVVERTSPTSWTVGATYAPPPGSDTDLHLSFPEMDGLESALVGKGPLLRAQGRQVWTKRTTLRRITGATEGEPLVHDFRWWVQSPREQAFILERLAAMVAEPIPSWGPVPLRVADFAVKLTSTVSLGPVGGQIKPQRVAGLHWAFTAGSLTQELGLRQLRP